MQLRELRSEFFDNSEIHFMIFDKDLRVIDVNQSTLTFYHLKRETLVGKHLTEISPDAVEKGLYDKYLQVLNSGIPCIIEDSISHPRYGNQFNRLKIFRVGEGLGVTASNFTKMKGIIDALELMSFKIIHDVNSPLSNILGISDMASEETDVAMMRKYCEMVRKSAQKLKDNMDEIRNALRFTKGEFSQEQIDFNSCINEVRQSLAFLDGYNKIRFDVEVNMTTSFTFDRQLVGSLLQNLIDNAIKYRGSVEPFIKIRVKQLENQSVMIEVEDNGIGIAESAQPRIFQPFYRATNKGQGTGLGLYALRLGIENHGGFISFQSKENEGTTFTIMLPNNK